MVADLAQHGQGRVESIVRLGIPGLAVQYLAQVAERDPFAMPVADRHGDVQILLMAGERLVKLAEFGIDQTEVPKRDAGTVLIVSLLADRQILAVAGARFIKASLILVDVAEVAEGNALA